MLHLMGDVNADRLPRPGPRVPRRRLRRRSGRPMAPVARTPLAPLTRGLLFLLPLRRESWLAFHLQRARQQRAPALRPHQIIVPHDPPKRGVVQQPVDAPHAVAEAPAGHVVPIGGAVVPVRIVDRALVRRHLHLLLVHERVQGLAYLLDELAARHARLGVLRVDLDQPRHATRDDAQGGHAREGRGVVAPRGPGAPGLVVGAVAARGREEHVPLDVRAL